MLYKINKRDIPRASAVLADAFQNDPLWNKFFKGESDIEAKFRAFFECPVRICYKYGEVYAPSEKLEGIAACIPGNLSYVTIWRSILSGTIIPGLRMGIKTGKKMQPVFSPLENDRKENMKGKSFIYLNVLGVATELQGQGFGGKLLRALIDKYDASGIPIYLETELEKNVNFYRKFGFSTIKRVTLAIVDHPMWEMVREPK